MAEWISVKEGLPEEGSKVLVAFRGRTCFMTYLWNGCFETESGCVVNEHSGVTHWMPMPEPPKEDSK